MVFIKHLKIFHYQMMRLSKNFVRKQKLSLWEKECNIYKNKNKKSKKER